MNGTKKRLSLVGLSLLAKPALFNSKFEWVIQYISCPLVAPMVNNLVHESDHVHISIDIWKALDNQEGNANQ